MGLFGKDGKAKEGKDGVPSKEAPLVEGKSSEVAVIQDAPQSETKNNISCWFKEARGQMRSWRQKSKEWRNNPQFQEFNCKRKEFAQQFCHPMGDFFQGLPTEMTDFKYSLFKEWNYRKRLFGLEALTLFTAIITLRARRSQLGLPKRFMLAIRNSTGVFFLGGLMVAPEIYNPLIKSDF